MTGDRIFSAVFVTGAATADRAALPPK